MSAMGALTHRQRQVLRELTRGRTEADIAGRLRIRVLKRIRSQCRVADLPVVLFTALTAGPQLEQAQQLGASAILFAEGEHDQRRRFLVGSVASGRSIADDTG